MSTTPIKDLVDATQLTDTPAKIWIEGPVWKERGQTVAISSMEDDALLTAKAKVLGWLGKHGNFLLDSHREITDLREQMNNAKKAGDDKAYFDILAHASQIAEAIIDRQRRVGSLQAVLSDLDTEIGVRGLRTFSDIVTLSTLITEHPSYYQA